MEITEYAVALLRAAYRGEALPGIREPRAPGAVANQERFTGEWQGADGLRLQIMSRGGQLAVQSGGIERPLRRVDDTSFVTDHPALPPYTLDFGEPSKGLWLGGRLLARGRAPEQPPVAPALTGLVGTYYDSGAWTPRHLVFARGERLFLGHVPITRADDGSWRFDDEELVSERAWFLHSSGGRAQTLNLSGQSYTHLADS